jgi:hypothetical protein
MGTTMPHSSSCQELLRANRPGFPEGLKVRDTSRPGLTRGGARGGAYH